MLPGEGSWCLHLLMDPRAQIGAWGIQNLGRFSAGWVQPRTSHTGHPGTPVSAPRPPPGRREEDSDHSSPVVAKHCPATARRTLQPSPRQAFSSLGPPALKASSTHQPTHGSAATGQRRSHVSRFSGSHEKKAAWHISGEEGCRQEPEQAWGEKTSPLGTGGARTPHVHRYTLVTLQVICPIPCAPNSS